MSIERSHLSTFGAKTETRKELSGSTIQDHGSLPTGMHRSTADQLRAVAVTDDGLNRWTDRRRHRQSARRRLTYASDDSG